MTQDAIAAPPDLSLARLVYDIMVPERLSFLPVIDEDVLLGYVDADLVAEIDQENWSSTRVGDVYARSKGDAVVAPGMSIDDLLARIVQTGRRKFLVANDERLLGVITLADLVRHLVLWKSLRSDA